MPQVSIQIPQMGEGLQEARLVAFLKQPGDFVRRDEPLFQMETDKAVLDVESPFEGTVIEWLAQPDDLLPIGTKIGTLETGDEPAPPTEKPVAAPVEAKADVPAPGQGLRNATAPPRTVAYAREKGLTDEEISRIPTKGTRMTPEDVDAFLTSGSKAYETPISSKQRLLANRLQKAYQVAVPSALTVVAPWAPVENLKRKMAASGDAFQPSAFTIFAYAVAKALPEHPVFRSQWVGDGNVRTYPHATLGIAVARPGDELLLAAVSNADALDWRTFAETTRQSIHQAREGLDQASEAITISLTNLQAQGVRDGLPVVVPPAMATLLLGEPYWAFTDSEQGPALGKVVNLTLAFDHRLANGIGAANFVNAIKQNLAEIGKLIPEA